MARSRPSSTPDPILPIPRGAPSPPATLTTLADAATAVVETRRRSGNLRLGALRSPPRPPTRSGITAWPPRCSSRPSAVTGQASYAYSRLPFDLTMSFRRSVTPVLYRPGSTPLHPPESEPDERCFVLPCRASSTTMPSASATRLAGSTARCHPFHPDRSRRARRRRVRCAVELGSVHLGWSYSNAEAYLHSVGTERGFTLALAVDVAAPPLASDYTFHIVSYAAAEYLPHALGAASATPRCVRRRPRRVATTFPGASSTRAGSSRRHSSDPLLAGRIPGPFVPRGYPAFCVSASQYHLFNAEYRFLRS